MGNLHCLPVDSAAIDRLIERHRVESIRAEQAEAVRIARAVFQGQHRYSDEVLADACAALRTWGDRFDRLSADQMALVLRERADARRHKAAEAAAEETSVRIAMRHAPQIIAVGKGLLLAALVALGFGLAVL